MIEGLRIAAVWPAIVMLALAGCRTLADGRHVAPGVATVEIVVPVTIPANRARAIFQDGRPVYAADPYRPSCELEVSTVSARDQQVGRDIFVVTRRYASMLSDPDHRLPLYGPFVDITCGDLIYYEVEYRLASDRQPGVRHLRCRQGFNACWGRGGFPGLDAVRDALGTGFRIE